MEIKSAIALVDEIVYKPGYFLTSWEHTNFESTITVRVDYSAPNYNREWAPNYPTQASSPNYSFNVQVRDLDRTSFLKVVLQHLLVIEEHESREAFRLRNHDYEAPFHPHRIDGMNAWGNPQHDLTFGLV